MQKTDLQIQMFFSKPIHDFKIRPISKGLKKEMDRVERMTERQKEILLNGNWDLYQRTNDEDLAIWLSDPENLKKAIKVFIFAAISVMAIGYNFYNIRVVLIITFLLWIRSLYKKKPPVS